LAEFTLKRVSFLFCRYNHEIPSGKTIVAGLPYGLYARVRPLEANVLRLRSTTEDGQIFETELPLDEDVLAAEAQNGSFFSYAAGTSYVFATEYHVGGLEIDNYKTTLPLKKGLSSSAAMCVLVARAFNQIYKLNLTTRGEMQAAFHGERLTPSQCGRMDQAVAFGSVPVVMTYSGDILKVMPLHLAKPLYMVLVDLKAKKDTVRILEDLQRAYPHPGNDKEQNLVELLGNTNQKLTNRAITAMEDGDPEELGSIMIQAQTLFDLYAGAMCPDQLGAEGSPILRKVLEYEAIQKLTLGRKGVGSQGDGSAQILCCNEEAQEEVCRILEADLNVHCLKVTLEATTGLKQEANGWCSN
jgi:galactokinase